MVTPRAFLFLYMSKRKGKKNLAFLLIMGILLCGTFVLWRVLDSREQKPITELNPNAIPEGFSGYGIDVSHYQNQINWQLLDDSNGDKISFVYFKVTEGVSLVDKYAERNHDSLKHRQWLRGGYHFYIPGNDPTKQAKHFLANYKPDDEDLPPVLDIENETGTRSKLISDLKIWLDHVKKETGRQSIIYTSYDMYRRFLRDAFPDHYFWVANYSKRQDRFKDERILYWQFSDKGILPGIDGFVDLNYHRHPIE